MTNRKVALPSLPVDLARTASTTTSACLIGTLARQQALQSPPERSLRSSQRRLCAPSFMHPAPHPRPIVRRCFVVLDVRRAVL
eukprot:11012836-Alexandrium_andersonii.AAC.1